MSEHTNESPAGRPASGPPEGLEQPSGARGRQLPLVTVWDECGDGTQGWNLGRVHCTKSTAVRGWGAREGCQAVEEQDGLGDRQGGLCVTRCSGGRGWVGGTTSRDGRRV